LSKPFVEVQQDLVKWADTCALSAGIKLENNSDEAKTEYVNKRNALVAKFHSGDPQIVEQLSAVTPPPDADAYYKVSDAYIKRDELIARKKLGENATLEEYWGHVNFVNGNFNKAADLSKAEGLVEGRNAVVNVMTNNEQKNARTLDQNPTDAGHDKHKRVMQVLNTTPQERANDPALQAEFLEYWNKYKPKDMF